LSIRCDASGVDSVSFPLGRFSCLEFEPVCVSQTQSCRLWIFCSIVLCGLCAVPVVAVGLRVELNWLRSNEIEFVDCLDSRYLDFG